MTAFFRDPEAWEFIADDVIPRLFAERAPTDPIRVWIAGCASGQEAYTCTSFRTPEDGVGGALLLMEVVG